MIAQNDIFEQVKKVLLRRADLKLVIVYGSVVTEAFRNTSDVDIAVLLENPMDADDKLDLLGELSNVLKRDVDLVDLYKLNGVLLKQILTKGVIIFKLNDSFVYKLLKRMIYNQSDFMPYYHREVKNRVEDFING